MRALRDRLEETILRAVPDTFRNGATEPRLPNTSNIAFAGVEAEGILASLDQLGICVSSGSACTTGSLNPSHVLTAMGLKPARAKGCVRFSLGIYNTDGRGGLFVDSPPARYRPPAPSRAGQIGPPARRPARRQEAAVRF